MSDWCARCGNYMGEDPVCYYCANEEPPTHEPAPPLSVKYEQLQARCAELEAKLHSKSQDYNALLDDVNYRISELDSEVRRQQAQLQLFRGYIPELEAEKAELANKCLDADGVVKLATGSHMWEKSKLSDLRAIADKLEELNGQEN